MSKKELQRITTETHSFEVVDTIPRGYAIWCINTDDMEGYLPLYNTNQVTNHQINTKTLKAVKCNDAAKIVHCSVWLGVGTLEEAKKKLMYPRRNSRKNGKVQKTLYERQLLLDTIPLMEKLTWE